MSLCAVDTPSVGFRTYLNFLFAEMGSLSSNEENSFSGQQQPNLCGKRDDRKKLWKIWHFFSLIYDNIQVFKLSGLWLNVRTIEYRVRWQKDVLNWLLCICPCSFYILDSKFEATRQTVVFVCIGYNIFRHVIFSASSSSPSSWIFVCSFSSRFMLFLLHMYMLHCAHRTHTCGYVSLIS